MKTRLVAALLPLSLALAACGADPLERTDSGSPDVKASLIATVDGCRIWRVKDGSSRTVYIAKCPDAESRAEWTTTTMVGKTPVTKHHETLTVRP